MEEVSQTLVKLDGPLKVLQERDALGVPRGEETDVSGDRRRTRVSLAARLTFIT